MLNLFSSWTRLKSFPVEVAHPQDANSDSLDRLKELFTLSHRHIQSTVKYVGKIKKLLPPVLFTGQRVFLEIYL